MKVAIGGLVASPDDAAYVVDAEQRRGVVGVGARAVGPGRLDAARLPRGPDEHDQAGHRHRAARVEDAGDAGHVGHVDADALGRAVPARHRYQRPAGDGGLARGPLPVADQPDARHDRDRPHGRPGRPRSPTPATPTSFRCPTAPAALIRSMLPPTTVPVYVASMGPRNLELTGELADGWLGNAFMPEHAEAFLGPLRAGAARAGRSLDELDLLIPVAVEFTDDVDEAARRHSAWLRLHDRGHGRAGKNFYNAAFSRQGFADDVIAVQDLWLSGRREEAAARVPRDIGFKTNLLGPPAMVKERLRLYRDAGITTLQAKLDGPTPAAPRHLGATDRAGRRGRSRTRPHLDMTTPRPTTRSHDDRHDPTPRDDRGSGRVEADGVHPLRVQLRHRGAPRRRRRPPLRAHPRRQGPPGLGRATRARRRCASTTTRTAAHRLTQPAAARGPTAPSRRSTGTPPSPRWPRGFAPGARHPRRRVDLLLRRRRAGEPPRRRLLRRPRCGRFGVALPLERPRPGEDRRVLGERQDARHATCGATSSTAEVGAVRRQEPVAEPRHPPRPHHAQGDRPRPGPLDDRASTRAAPRRPSWPTSTCRCGPAPTPGCLAALGAVLVQEDLLDRAWLAAHATGARRGRRAPAARSTIAAYCAVARRRRGPRAARRPPHRRRPAASPCSRTSACRCRCTPRCRATWRSCSGCSPATSATPGAQYVPTSLVNIAGAGVSRGAVDAHAARWPGARIISGLVPCNVDRRGDPHRPPRPLPGHARRERQPGPLARRQPADARGARRRSTPRRDRRRHDRDGPPGRLRAAGAVAVREVGGDVLQLRLPAATSSTCAARCWTRLDGHAARAGDPRPARRGAGRLDRRRPGAAASRRRARAGPPSPTRSSPPLAAKPALGALAPDRALPHARPDPARRRRRGRRPVGRRPPVRAGRTRRRCARGRLQRRGARARRAALRRHPRQPVRASSSSVDEPEETLAPASRPTTASSTSPSPSCSTSSTALADGGRRPAATPSSRSCCRPASGARSPPTRSSATRRGGRSDAAGPLRISPADAAALGRRRRRPRPGHHQARPASSSRSRSTTSCSRATSRCPTASASTTPTSDGPAVVTGAAPNELTASEDRDRSPARRGTSTCPPASSPCSPSPSPPRPPERPPGERCGRTDDGRLASPALPRPRPLPRPRVRGRASPGTRCRTPTSR